MSKCGVAGTEIEFTESTKGGRKLSKNGRTYLECSQRPNEKGCNVNMTMDTADRVIAQMHQHSHTADPEDNDLLKAKEGIKQFTKDAAEKNMKHH